MQESDTAPFLSFALATYNRWHELQPVLQAFLPQIVPGIELVISDNASPDGTADLAQRYCAGNPHVRILRHTENVGAVANFRDAVEAARGQYVMFLADDDIPSPGFVRFVRQTLNDRPGAGVYHFEPNPAPGRTTSYRAARSGIDGVLLIFAYSGMIPGLMFPRASFNRDLWRPAPHLYPQVFLACSLAREGGTVIASGPDGLTLGGETDSSASRARSRPDDFGVAERLRHLASAIEPLPGPARAKILDYGAHEMTVWGFSIYKEMMSENRQVGRRFLSALMRISAVHDSPYLLGSWLRWIVLAHGSLASARYVLPAVARGYARTVFGRTAHASR